MCRKVENAIGLYLKGSGTGTLGRRLLSTPVTEISGIPLRCVTGPMDSWSPSRSSSSGIRDKVYQIVRKVRNIIPFVPPAAMTPWGNASSDASDVVPIRPTSS